MSDLQESGSRKKAVVVVPVYKTELDDVETASLINNAAVLKNHDVVVVYSEGLDVSFYKRIVPALKYQAFRKSDFSSVKHYDRLLISPRFYRAFAEYEYMLICQYDAWIFKDELNEWCDKGYDYVGAPFVDPFVGQLSARMPFLSTLCMNKVGNGGLSLRKISTHIKVTHRMQCISPLCTVTHEDIFFTLFAPLFLRNYRRPDMEEANRFAVDKKARECVGRLNGALPFGCHGWYKRSTDFWSQYIKPECDIG